MHYDTVIVGGGPAGLTAALVLGRARRRVLLCDGETPRNARAAHVHGFVTRDGTPPAEFRRIAREQLAPYTSVKVRDESVVAIDGEHGAFTVRLADGDVVEARRVILAVGMVDELPAMLGFRELWGTSIVLCPYCHGWESRDGAFGCLVPSAAWLDWPLMLRAWTRDVTVFTAGAFEVPQESRDRLANSGIALETRPVRRIVGDDGQIRAIELEDGDAVRCDLLFARPQQRQTAIVESLGLELDDLGFVRVDEQRRTSRPGIYAAGDLTTMMQGALFAAAAGSLAAAMLNHELVPELAQAGVLTLGDERP